MALRKRTQKRKCGVRPHVKLDSKNAAIMKAIYYNPHMKSIEMAERLKREGVKGPKGETIRVNTTEGNVKATKHLMRRGGIELPKLLKKGSRKKRKSPRTTAIEVILANPKAGTKEIQKKLKKRNIIKTREAIRQLRYRIKKRGIELPDLNLEKPPKKIPKLSKKQEQLKFRAMSHVNKAMATAKRRYNFREETFKDFKQQVMMCLPQWVVNFNPKKGELRKYVQMNVSYEAIHFIRAEMQTNLGISRRESQQLSSLIAGARKGKTIEETAREKGIPLKDAKELWEAYEAYKKTISYGLLREER